MQIDENSNIITLVTIIIIFIITISQDNESPGIVKTTHSSIFRYIQEHSAIVIHVKTYWGIFRYYWGLQSHNETYSELWVTLAYAAVPYSEP